MGKKPDRGNSCLRLRKLEDLPLPAILDLVASMPVEDSLAACEMSRRRREP